MHKGIIGKLAFRRDFTLNWDPLTRVQWFDSFIWRVPQLPTGQAQPLQGHVLQTKATEYMGLDTMFWDGPFVQASLHFYKLQLKSQIDRWRYIREGAVLVSGFGIIWHWHYSTALGGSQIPNWGAATFPVTDFWSTDWFDSEPQQPAGIRGRLWAEEPPPP